MRQGELTPWPVTPSPRPPVEFKCPSDSEGKRESEVGGDYGEYERERAYSEYSGFEGLSIDGPFIDYVNSSHPQISDLKTGPFIRMSFSFQR